MAITTPGPVFDLEQDFDDELQPMIESLSKRARELGIGLIVISHFASDGYSESDRFGVSFVPSLGKCVPLQMMVIEKIMSGGIHTATGDFGTVVFTSCDRLDKTDDDENNGGKFH